MNKLLISSLSLAAFTATSNAQITPSQTTNGNTLTTIDCFKFTVEEASPLGTDIASGGTISLGGGLSGGTYLPDISGYSITSFVSHFNTSGSTTASLNNGILSFTGSVGLITTPDQLKETKGLDGTCRTLDFSFTQCTQVDEGSKLFEAISETERAGYKAYFGVIGDESRSVAFSDAFKYNEKTNTYEYDTPKFEAGEKERISMYYVDARGISTEFAQSEETTTIFKDFTVCVECTEVVPEPSSTALLGLGTLSLLIRRKR